MSKTVFLMTLLSIAGSTTSMAFAADPPEQAPTNQTSALSTAGEMTEASATSDMTKAELRELEQKKEKSATSKGSGSEGALMIMRNILSF